MTFADHLSVLPLEQQRIRANCYHARGTFVAFSKQDIEQSVAERFALEVRRHPDRLAVKSRSHTLTYAELDKTANRIAWAILQTRGQGQRPVALLFRHGASGIAAILGSLKAGSPYVPLEPSIPRARAEYILDDAQACMLVTDNDHLALATALVKDGCPLLNIDRLGSDLSTLDPAIRVSQDTISCILYTSGSQGQPKGVMQTGANMMFDIGNFINTLHICADDRLVLLRSAVVVGSIREIFGALLSGASIYPFDVKGEGFGHLSDWLTAEGITVLCAVTTVFRHFASTLNAGEHFPTLRLLRLGGEPVQARDLDLYRKHFSPACVFLNGVGSTETFTFLLYFIDKQSQLRGNTVPAGFPVEGKEVLLLDEDGREVGPNQTGEIAVRSRYLSPGYWRRPDLTRRAFVPAPDGHAVRTYLTGDLGLMQQDGCLLYLGRKDSQVKVRGHRVETGEIETVLLEHPSIKEAVAMAREDASGEMRLVGYLVPAVQPAPSARELRNALQQKLPDYMVPQTFMFLEALPTLPTGKVDRRALPIPGRARPQLANPYLAPRTPVERDLVALWAEILGIDEVGIDDNLLELGGDSLQAGRIVARVINCFRVELPLRSLFESPTVAAMAEAITAGLARTAERADIETLLAEVEALSPENAKRLLTGARAKD